MTIKVYNTLTRRVEPFKPWKDKTVGIYVCGPTVYDYSHIGHARAYIAFDVIVRHLRYRGYNVKYVMNITDVEDKIINRAREMGIDPVQLASKFEDVFFENMTQLGIVNADVYPRVSDHIAEIIEVVHTLIRKGFGYEVDGDVYFDVTRFESYGQLSQQSLNGIRSGARVEVDERKKNPADFALWKSAKAGEISWESPWGRGRPGWHIECSAMANKYLGVQFEIHGGGQDLIFPHHENEIAQSEAYTGQKPVVKYWLHNGLLTIGGEKMSKSLGNFISIGDLLNRFDAEVLRLFVISTHYRRPIDFTDEKLEHTKQSLLRVYGTVENLRERGEGVSEATQAAMFGRLLHESMEEFVAAMDDDFNTPRALAAFYKLVQVGNRALSVRASRSVLVEILNSIMEVAQIFGILGKVKEQQMLSEEAARLLKEREALRRKKNWERADELREKLRALGIIVEDLPGGTRWRYAEPT